MNDNNMLPADLLWQDDGHVTDVVVDTLADGQDEVVPAPARDHVSACDMCAQRLGDAVLLAMRVGDVLEGAMSTARVAQPSWPIPVPAVLAAVLVAALGTIPALGDLGARITELVKSIVAVVPNLTRAALVLSRTGEFGTQLALLSMVSVAVLLVGGLMIARAVPRETPLRGGAR